MERAMERAAKLWKLWTALLAPVRLAPALEPTVWHHVEAKRWDNDNQVKRLPFLQGYPFVKTSQIGPRMLISSKKIWNCLSQEKIKLSSNLAILSFSVLKLSGIKIQNKTFYSRLSSPGWDGMPGWVDQRKRVNCNMWQEAGLLPLLWQGGSTFERLLPREPWLPLLLKHFEKYTFLKVKIGSDFYSVSYIALLHW